MAQYFFAFVLLIAQACNATPVVEDKLVPVLEVSVQLPEFNSYAKVCPPALEYKLQPAALRYPFQAQCSIVVQPLCSFGQQTINFVTLYHQYKFNKFLAFKVRCAPSMVEMLSVYKVEWRVDIEFPGETDAHGTGSEYCSDVKLQQPTEIEIRNLEIANLNERRMFVPKLSVTVYGTQSQYDQVLKWRDLTQSFTFSSLGQNLWTQVLDQDSHLDSESDSDLNIQLVTRDDRIKCHLNVLKASAGPGSYFTIVPKGTYKVSLDLYPSNVVFSALQMIYIGETDIASAKMSGMTFSDKIDFVGLIYRFGVKFAFASVISLSVFLLKSLTNAESVGKIGAILTLDSSVEGDKFLQQMYNVAALNSVGQSLLSGI
ncbi:hypothetical protein MP228_006100 [Amoeboaphelidium protococcarum]|nr:hypothetical protein MP228_006100 [Amoeboaphelidium protococcarum]